MEGFTPILITETGHSSVSNVWIPDEQDQQDFYTLVINKLSEYYKNKNGMGNFLGVLFYEINDNPPDVISQKALNQFKKDFPHNIEEDLLFIFGHKEFYFGICDKDLNGKLAYRYLRDDYDWP